MAYVERDSVDPRLYEVRRQAWARDLMELRMRYAIEDAWDAGCTIRDIAAMARLPESDIAARIQQRPHLPELPRVPGRLGRRPMEVILRYVTGEIPWEMAREDLVEWPYVPQPWEADAEEDIANDVPGSFQEIFVALNLEMLSYDEYDDLVASIRDESADDE